MAIRKRERERECVCVCVCYQWSKAQSTTLDTQNKSSSITTFSGLKDLVSNLKYEMSNVISPASNISENSTKLPPRLLRIFKTNLNIHPVEKISLKKKKKKKKEICKSLLSQMFTSLFITGLMINTYRDYLLMESRIKSLHFPSYTLIFKCSQA
jgi:hypothetical protein